MNVIKGTTSGANFADVGRILIGKSGLYFIAAAVGFASHTTGMRSMRIKETTAGVTTVISVLTTPTSSTGSVDMKLATGVDYPLRAGSVAVVEVWQNSATNLELLTDSCYLSVRRVADY